MTKQVSMFDIERNYIGLDVTITDNYGAKTRVAIEAIYNEGEDDLYLLMKEFKRVLVAAGYTPTVINHIQYLDDEEMKQAEAAGIHLTDLYD